MAMSELMRGLTAVRPIRRRAASRTSVALVVLAVSGLAAVGVSEGAAQAGPSGGLNFYVSPTGSNADNPCTSAKLPCQTISDAVAEQGNVSHGGIIHVAAGTYTDDVTLGPSNSSVTIEGVSSKRTIIQPPSSGLSSTPDPNGGSPLFSVIKVDGGASNVTLDNFSVNGASGRAQLASTGCTQEYAGIFYDGASGMISKVAVTGIDMPATDPAPRRRSTAPGRAVACMWPPPRDPNRPPTWS
jgi:hypothetical protein